MIINVISVFLSTIEGWRLGWLADLVGLNKWPITLLESHWLIWLKRRRGPVAGAVSCKLAHRLLKSIASEYKLTQFAREFRIGSDGLHYLEFGIGITRHIVEDGPEW